MPDSSSKKPLAEKLGIMPGDTIAILNAPPDFCANLGKVPAGCTDRDLRDARLDYIHVFSRSGAELEAKFPKLKQSLTPRGRLWISWPKRAAKVATDLNENIVREIGLKQGLVDVKVASIYAVWSALKFVHRRTDKEPRL